MNDAVRAFTELRKTLLEMQITTLDQQAIVLALQATLLEVGGKEAGVVLANRHAAEKHKLLATRDSLATDVQLLQTILEKSPRSKTPVH
jgi:hypothetical protein